ncbi:hypothetical protein BsWGS_03453 [Bradybaena similaris]
MISTLLTLSILLGIGAVSEAKPRPAKCKVSGNVYRHGDTFAVPGKPKCFKYRCAHGNINFYEGACEINGQCVEPMASVEQNCQTYTCKVSTRGDSQVFKAELSKTKCQDYLGACREPGETFKFEVNDQLYNKCTCTISKGFQVGYNCKT